MCLTLEDRQSQSSWLISDMTNACIPGSMQHRHFGCGWFSQAMQLQINAIVKKLLCL